VGKGFSASQVGLLLALNPLAMLLVVPPVTYVCDRFHCNKQVVFAGCVVSTLLLVVMLLASDHSVTVASAIALFVVSNPLEPLLDQHTMAMLPPHEKNAWGSCRVYGAYGWGLGAPLSAQLVQYLGLPVLAVQYALGRLAILFCVATGAVHSVPEPTSIRYLQVLSFVLLHRRMMLFLICVCIMGMGYIFIATFLFLYLQSLGAPDILLGLSITTTVVVEIPLFIHSAWIHAHFSDRQLFVASMIGWAARVTGYSFLTNPWMVLLLEPFHGFTFGCMWLASVHYCQATFPKSLSASSFGFLHAAAFGVGPFVGNIVGGQLYESLGPRTMFRASAVAMLVVMVIYVVLDTWLAAKESTKDGDLAVDPAGPSELRESPRCKDCAEHLPKADCTR
jgi:MFS family permease